MKKAILSLCGLSLLVLAGCGSPTNSTNKSTAKATTPSHVSELKTYMKQNYKGTTWYSHITKYETEGSVLKIYTNLYPKTSNKSTASIIGHAALTDSKAGFKNVFVYAKDKTSLFAK